MIEHVYATFDEKGEDMTQTRSNAFIDEIPPAHTGGKIYLCIDLKSFYASVECADRGLDPFTTNLVVADPARTRTTICLAITPAMKALGVRNRCRVFEIPEGIKYITAVPRMRRYMEVSNDIFRIYLQHVSAQDIRPYSIDESFIDATPYLRLYGLTPRQFARMLMDEVLDKTGTTATAGIGTNLFLAKVALDVTAKHEHDCIGYLNEESFRQRIWWHQPITDIWSIGPGIARRLHKHGIDNLAGVAAANPDVLKREFGINATYLIDHAWGLEPCTIQQVRDYKPEGHSMTNGQVLPCDYTFHEARMVLREMVDASVLELVANGMVCERIFLSVGYAKQKQAPKQQRGALFDGGHGLRPVNGWGAPRSAASRKLERRTNSGKLLQERFCQLFDETVSRTMPVKRLAIGFGDLLPERFATQTLFDDVDAERKERALQDAVVAVRSKYGRNAMLKGTSLQDKATARERNNQVGGHRA